jgi:hypothetical protein
VKILNSIFVVAFLLGLRSYVAAATLFEFDTPYLFAELAGGKINGYYGLSLPEVNGRPSASCEFFFTSGLMEPSNRDRISITAFYTNGTFDKRAHDEVLPGELLINEKKWSLEMDQVPFGCLSAAGGGFLKGVAIPNDVMKKTLVTGIFVVNRKVSFFDKKENSFVKRKGFLVPGNAVVVYSKSDGFYFVRYLNTLTSVVTEAWLPMESISNPFP